MCEIQTLLTHTQHSITKMRFNLLFVRHAFRYCTVSGINSVSMIVIGTKAKQNCHAIQIDTHELVYFATCLNAQHSYKQQMSN